MMSKRAVMGNLAGCAMFAVSVPAGAATIYEQTSDNKACTVTCWTSSVGSDGTGGYRSYDDFRLDRSASIDQVSWVGFYADSTAPYDPAASTTRSWTIGFFADGPGYLPGVELYSVSLPAARVTATQVGTSTYPDLGPVSVYAFSALLPQAFIVPAGSYYWFSPLSVQPSFEPIFSWSGANYAGGYTGQTQLAGTLSGPARGPFRLYGDRAFTLSGSAVPEPATWTMMIAGLGLVGMVLRSRSRASAYAGR